MSSATGSLCVDFSANMLLQTAPHWICCSWRNFQEAGQIKKQRCFELNIRIWIWNLIFNDMQSKNNTSIDFILSTIWLELYWGPMMFNSSPNELNFFKPTVHARHVIDAMWIFLLVNCDHVFTILPSDCYLFWTF